MPMRSRHVVGLLSLLALPASLATCASDNEAAPEASAGGSAGAAGSAPQDDAGPGGSCKPLCFEAGDPDGHADPKGAKAAGQARAGRIKDASLIRQPLDARQRVNVGDFLLVNDKIGVYIEDRGFSDGYARFGGEILAIERVGDDGLPEGKSRYGETLMAISSEMVDPESVTVLNDGSDGNPAVVRAMGTLKSIPFLGSLKAVFPHSYGVPALYDFILAPGSDKLQVRLGVKNTTEEPLDLRSDEMHGFFHLSRSQMVTAEYGYGEPTKGKVSWVGFDSGESSFAWRTPGRKLAFALEISGFLYYTGDGFPVDVGETKFVDYVEVIPGGPGMDGVAEAVRRADGDTSHRAVSGKLVDAKGAPVAGAYVHELSPEGAYLSRVVTDDAGSFTIHAPASPVQLVARKTGFPELSGVTVSPEQTEASLAFPDNGRVHVVAKEESTGTPVPVRVQIIPTVAPKSAPAAWGETDQPNGRLHQEFAMSGEATLEVPPGEHKVVISHGYEWDLLEQTITVAAGEVVEVAAPMVHSVDTTGVMCADFHIHSFFSADSNDPVIQKVKSAIADGLDIPVSSEHEWIIDFQPVIKELGMTKWAFGMPSEELTTFTWGHFGVIPIRPRPELPNQGAVDWIGKEPPAFFKEVHAQPDKPLLIINHPSGGGFGAYFSSSSFKRDTAKGSAKLWSDEFEAIEVFNSSDLDKNRNDSVGDWFALLEHGRRVWAVGSSDSHHITSSPVGYPRSCIGFGHDDPEKLTPEAVRDGVASGNLTISGGLYMVVKGPNGEGPGMDVQSTGGEVAFQIDVAAASWVEADTLEVIVNGKTLSEEPLAMVGGGPGKRFSNKVTVPVDASRPLNWVVFHAKGSGDLAPLHPGRKPFAVSNPVFLKLACSEESLGQRGVAGGSGG
jgi:hypothetical protein